MVALPPKGKNKGGEHLSINGLKNKLTPLVSKFFAIIVIVEEGLMVESVLT